MARLPRARSRSARRARAVAWLGDGRCVAARGATDRSARDHGDRLGRARAFRRRRAGAVYAQPRLRRSWFLDVAVAALCVATALTPMARFASARSGLWLRQPYRLARTDATAARAAAGSDVHDDGRDRQLASAAACRPQSSQPGLAARPHRTAHVSLELGGRAPLRAAAPACAGEALARKRRSLRAGTLACRLFPPRRAPSSSCLVFCRTASRGDGDAAPRPRGGERAATGRGAVASGDRDGRARALPHSGATRRCDAPGSVEIRLGALAAVASAHSGLRACARARACSRTYGARILRQGDDRLAAAMALLPGAEPMSAAGPPQGANCAPSGGSAAAELLTEAASVGVHICAAGPPQGANCAPSLGGSAAAELINEAASAGAHQ